MADIQIAIAGQNSVAATEALMAIPGVTGTWQADESARRDGGVTATIATVLGIVGGSMAIAEQIRKWDVLSCMYFNSILVVSQFSLM